MDQFTPDVRTINYALISIMTIMATILFAVRWQHKTIKGLFHWGMAYVCTAIVIFSLDLRGDLSNFYTVLVANYFNAAAFILYYYGCCKYLGKQPQLYLVLCVAVIFWGPFLFTYQSSEYFNLRVMLSSMGRASFCLMTAHILITTCRVEYFTQKILGCLFFVLGAMNLIRVIWFAGKPVTNIDFVNSNLNAEVARTAYMMISNVIPIGLATLIAVCFIVMVTERQRVELEARVHDLDIASNEKTAFLANMSHEIRTPLNAIIGFTGAMLLGVGGKVSSKKHVEYLTDIKDSGEHLAIVINDVLDLSKIESGNWVLSEEWFPLDNCVHNVFKMLSSLANEKEIELRFEEDEAVSIFGDEHAIKRIFINLISNSIKFSNIKSTIRCTVNKAGDGRIVVKVIDTGTGISEYLIDDILKPFIQNQNTHRLSDEGTGLGLPIVQNLIELHGGEFKLKSEVNVGTEAIFTLPTPRVRVE